MTSFPSCRSSGSRSALRFRSQRTREPESNRWLCRTQVDCRSRDGRMINLLENGARNVSRLGASQPRMILRLPKSSGRSTTSGERSALDRVDTIRGGHSGPIESEDLGQPPWGILRESGDVVAAAIMGGAQLQDADRKKRITHVLFGSFYLIRLDGADEGNGRPEPRHLDVYSRLYSPFGIGTSVDFHYAYHYRRRFERQVDERFASLTARLRTIADCGAAPPSQSEDDEENEGPADAYVIFDSQEDGEGGLNTQFINETTLKQFEKSLFGTEGWLSPRKMTDILLAGGGVLQFQEADTEAAVSLLDKFQYFSGENTGKRALAPELKRLTLMEVTGPMNGPVCIPQNRLLLARAE
ncbi:hypothetical protein RSAG8_08132, partial [Rhizoctonia solani AG-8 WAC10335]